MRIVVKKFGGTSVDTYASRSQAIQHVRQSLDQGDQVVVVVSAMGRQGQAYATDTLLSLVPDRLFSTEREMDLLMSCGEIISAVVFASELREQGIDAVVLTGGQAGLITTDHHMQAELLMIDPSRILHELEQGRTAVVAGFQGRTIAHEITTLGRGGSDTTAVALGQALQANLVEIFSDVDGILTADPRIVSEAKCLAAVRYSDVCTLAYQGAKVIHPRAVEIAMQQRVPLRVRRTSSNAAGTLIAETIPEQAIERHHSYHVIGVTYLANLSYLHISGTYDVSGSDSLPDVFRILNDADISVHSVHNDPSFVSFAVAADTSELAASLLQTHGYQVIVRPNCAQVTTVGRSFHTAPGLMWRVLDTLHSTGVEVIQTTDSDSTICCLVPGEQTDLAVSTLHQAWHLHIDPHKKTT